MIQCQVLGPSIRMTHNVTMEELLSFSQSANHLYDKARLKPAGCTGTDIALWGKKSRCYNDRITATLWNVKTVNRRKLKTVKD